MGEAPKNDNDAAYRASIKANLPPDMDVDESGMRQIIERAKFFEGVLNECRRQPASKGWWTSSDPEPSFFKEVVIPTLILAVVLASICYIAWRCVQ